MNKVTVKINGIEYNLKGEENESYLISVAQHVDMKIKNLIEGNKNLSTSSASILAAMNCVDEMFKEKEEAKDIKNQFSLLKSQISYLENHNKDLEEKVEILQSSFNLKMKENNNTYEEKIKTLEELLKKNENEILNLKDSKEKLSLELQDKNIILNHRDESINNLQEEIHNLKEAYNKESLEKDINYQRDLELILEEKNSMELSLKNLENNIKESDNLIKSKVKDIEKFYNENRTLLQDNEGKEKELFNLKKEKSILNETKNELERDIRNLEIKFKDYEENNSYKDQVKELNNKLILLEKEAENHKKINKYLKEKSKDVSFNTTSNFYKLKSYENKYIDLIEDLIESQIKYICLNEQIKYIPPMDIHGYIENSDDFDIEEEVNFIIRNGQKYPDSLKNEIISKVFTA